MMLLGRKTENLTQARVCLKKACRRIAKYEVRSIRCYK